MLVAGVGFALTSIDILFLSLFLLGLHSTLFGPVMYAILPQHLKAEELVGGALSAAGMLAVGLTIPMLFAVAAICNAVVALFIYALVPEFLLRFIVWMLIHTVYRLRTENLAAVPDDRHAVIVCNHVSFVDAL